MTSTRPCTARLDAPQRASLLATAALLFAPAAARAAPGFAVCAGLDEGVGGRLVATAQPFAADSARAEAEAPAFARTARGQGKVQGALEPACHWEPTREKAADYLRRLRQGAGKKGAEAAEVAFTPAG